MQIAPPKRTSRKLLFAGGLVPIMLCHLHKREDVAPFLNAWLRAVPLDRLAATFLWFDSASEGARALEAYDRWLAIQLDSDKRAELRTLRHDTRDKSDLFREVVSAGHDFQRACLALFFDTNLSGLAQEYLVF